MSWRREEGSCRQGDIPLPLGGKLNWANAEKLSVSVSGSFERPTSQREADMCGTLSSLSMIYAGVCTLCLHCRHSTGNISAQRSKNTRDLSETVLSLWKKPNSPTSDDYSIKWSSVKSPVFFGGWTITRPLRNRLGFCLVFCFFVRIPAASFILSLIGAVISLCYWHFRRKETWRFLFVQINLERFVKESVTCVTLQLRSTSLYIRALQLIFLGMCSHQLLLSYCCARVFLQGHCS